MISDVKTGRLFVGSRESCKLFLRGRTESYIYILRRPDSRPFYVGQGAGPRIFFHEGEARHANNWKTNNHKLNVIRSIWKHETSVEYEIDLLTTDKIAINAREDELIRLHGRLHEGGPLTNRAPGGRSLAEPSPFSKERHTATLSGESADNPEQSTLNRFVQSIKPMNSAILKAESRRFIVKRTQINRDKMKFTDRQAAALAASAASNGILLDGPCILPRRVELNGVKGYVENGVACDIMVSRMATIVTADDPRDESFSLDGSQASTVVSMIGRQRCIDLGIVT